MKNHSVNTFADIRRWQVHGQKQDLTTFYFGGSGGFLLLQLTLLGGNHSCIFKNGMIFDVNNQQHLDMLKSQWVIGRKWKDSEIQPHFLKTVSYPMPEGTNRVMLIGNEFNLWKQSAKKVLLYTDIRSQIRLSYYKRAWKWEGTSSQLIHYRQDIRNLLNDATEFNDDLVYSYIPLLAKKADYVIKLQDLFKCPVKWFNPKQLDLLARWKAAHPADLLRKIGVNPDK